MKVDFTSWFTTYMKMNINFTKRNTRGLTYSVKTITTTTTEIPEFTRKNIQQLSGNKDAENRNRGNYEKYRQKDRQSIRPKNEPSPKTKFLHKLKTNHEFFEEYMKRNLPHSSNTVAESNEALKRLAAKLIPPNNHA